MITPEQIAELKRLNELRTPGPWAQANQVDAVFITAAANSMTALIAELEALREVAEAVEGLRTSEQLGAVEPPNGTPFYVLTVKSHNVLLEKLAKWRSLGGSRG